MISKMKFLSCIVMKEESEKIMKEFINAGVLHPVNIEEIEKDIKLPVGMKEEEKEILRIEERIKKLTEKAKLHFEWEKTENLTYQNVEKILVEIEKYIQPITEKEEKLQKEIQQEEKKLQIGKQFNFLPFKPDSYYSFIKIYFISVEKEKLLLLEEKLKNIHHILHFLREIDKNELFYSLIILKENIHKVEEIMEKLNVKKYEYPENLWQISQKKEEIEKKLEREKGEIRKIEEEIKNYLLKKNKEINAILSFISERKAILKFKNFSANTDETTIICGWIPEEDEKKIRGKIKNLPFWIEKEAEDIKIDRKEIPVKIRNNKFLKPFEMLVSTFGIPGYKTIDPTFFIALTFIFMFGFMFSDAGHGLILFLLGMFLFYQKKEIMKNSGKLIMYAGISSSLFGILFGSFFGIDFHPLFFKPIENTMKLVKIGIFTGISVITAGIIFNLINSAREKDYEKLFFDKNGLISGLIYWFSTGMIIKKINQKIPIHISYFIVLLFLFTLFISGPIFLSIFRRKEANILSGFFEKLMELIETALGYLSNTISFIRLSAFSLAHTGLFIAIFQISKILNHIANGSLSWFIIIMGNIFVIILEGMIVSIQALRLNYYEFFSKFFITGKKIYQPIKVEK